MELVTINPGVVLGPVLDDDYGTSGELVRKLLLREMPGCPRVGWAMVDVRDVAQMHLLAMTNKDAAGQRFVCAGEFAWVSDVAQILDQRFRARGYRVPLRKIPGWALRVAAVFDKTLALIVHDLDKRQDVSHARARQMLGWQPRSLEAMVVAMGESLIEHGVA
jgi:nucleoside-diphosphate-sugar epimerase